MGALISMRDDPMDAPLPERLEPETGYYDNMIAESEAAIERLVKLTKAEITAECDAANAEIIKGRLETVKKNEAQRQRYQALIDQTRQWQGAPEGIKEFMLSQLEQSLDFDVSDNPLQYYREPYAGPDDWFEEKLAKATRDVAYGTEHRDTAIKRVAERQAWLDQLRAALPPEEETK